MKSPGPLAGLSPAVLLAIVCSAGGCLVPESELDEDEDLPQTDRDQRAIVGGEVTTDLPSAGMLLIGGSPELVIGQCSLTLIGCNKVMTAAHCVCERFGAACGDPAPRFPTYAFFQHAGFFRVDTVDVHPDFNEQAEHDIAILTLRQPVRGIRPVALASQAVDPGSEAVIAGFGRPDGDEFEIGIKRRGLVTTTTCSPTLGVDKLCWLYDGSGSSDSNVCHGDSGGATFVEREGTLEIAGIHSTTGLPSCRESPEVESADTGVFDHREFIDERVLDPELGACGDLPQVGDPGAIIMTESGALELGESIDIPIEVPPGTAELRVAMNSSDGTGADFDLYLMAGATAGPGRFYCKAAGTSPHGFCQVESPAPGPWHIHVVAGVGFVPTGGRFQLVATVLDSAPIGRDDGYAAVENRPLVIEANDGVLENDQASHRGPIIAVVDRRPTHGRLEFNEDGSFVYTPRRDYVGPDSFRYRASDGTYSGVATVRLGVTAGEAERIPDDGGCATSTDGSGARGGGAAALALLLLIRLSRSGLPWRR